MKTWKVLFVILVLFILSSTLGLQPRIQALAQHSAENLAISFILFNLVDEQGGVLPRYLPLADSKDGVTKDQEILLQNNSLLMLYTTYGRYRQIFDQQVSLIRTYFLEEKMGLLHWKVDAQQQPIQSSWGTYSNDLEHSLRVIGALLKSYDLWKDEDYRELAIKISEGLKEYNLASDKTLRYFSSWDSKHKFRGRGDKVVLAQLNLGVLDRLAEIDKSWEEILTKNLNILLSGRTEQGLFYQNYLADKQKYEKGDGNMVRMSQVAYYLALYGRTNNASVAFKTARSFLNFVRGEYKKQGKIFGRYDPDTGESLVTWENIAIYALISRIALKLNDLSFAQTILSEKILPYQQLHPRSPVYGAFTKTFKDAYAFDTLQALLTLASWEESPVYNQFINRKGPIRAVWYLSWQRESYLQPTVVNDLLKIRSRLCPTHIGLFAIATQENKISSNPKRDSKKTASDEALRYVISQTHQLGMGVILLPPLFVDDGTWEGEIMPDNIHTWFNHWQSILLHYAKLAEETGVEVFLIGSELASLRNQTDEWIRLIEAVRKSYHGKLSYSANFWYDRNEYQKVLAMKQWKYLDYIGTTAYFELTDKLDPSIEELESAWHDDFNGQDVKADLESLSNRFGKSIVFWEIGYESKNGTNTYPWDFPRPGEKDEGEQADAWAAFLNVFKNINWFEGYGIYAEHVGLPTKPKTYTVLGKVAEGVLGTQCNE